MLFMHNNRCLPLTGLPTQAYFVGLLPEKNIVILKKIFQKYFTKYFLKYFTPKNFMEFTSLKYLQNVINGFDEISERMGRGMGNNRLDICGYPDHNPDPGTLNYLLLRFCGQLRIKHSPRRRYALYRVLSSHSKSLHSYLKR